MGHFKKVHHLTKEQIDQYKPSAIGNQASNTLPLQRCSHDPCHSHIFYDDKIRLNHHLKHFHGLTDESSFPDYHRTAAELVDHPELTPLTEVIAKQPCSYPGCVIATPPRDFEAYLRHLQNAHNVRPREVHIYIAEVWAEGQG